MKNLQFLGILSTILIIEGKINISISAATNVSDATVIYSGIDTKIATDEEIDAFGLTRAGLKSILNTHYGRKPSSFYVRRPTPWGDLYKTYNWEPVTRVVAVKSTRIKSVSRKPVVVMTHDFDNFSEKPIKLTSSVTQTVENTISTAWSRSNEVTFGQELEYDLSFSLAKASGTTSFSHTSTWGKSEEKAETVSIEASTGVEMELAPGKSARAVLSASRGDIEVEVVYVAKLRGNVAVNFKKAYNQHHFWGPNVEDLMREGGLSNEIVTVETITLGFYSDATLKIYDKVTGTPL